MVFIVVFLLNFSFCSHVLYSMEKKVVVLDRSSMVADQGHEVTSGAAPIDEVRIWTKWHARHRAGLAALASKQESKGTQAGDSLPRICAICQDQLEGTDLQIILPCNRFHIFHNSCFVRWATTTSEPHCPMCRQSVENVVSFLLINKLREKEAALRIEGEKIKQREGELIEIERFKQFCEREGLSVEAIAKLPLDFAGYEKKIFQKLSALDQAKYVKVEELLQLDVDRTRHELKKRDSELSMKELSLMMREITIENREEERVLEFEEEIKKVRARERELKKLIEEKKAQLLAASAPRGATRSEEGFGGMKKGFLL